MKVIHLMLLSAFLLPTANQPRSATGQESVVAKGKRVLATHRRPDPSPLAYDSTDPALRLARSKKYNTPFHTILSQISSDAILSNASGNRRYREMPSLPVAESAAIVLGEVVDRHAYFSEDQTAIYTEYLVSVTTTLKTVIPEWVRNGESVLCIREGGSIVLKNGSTASWLVLGQGFPQDGEQYLLFLKWHEDEQIFSILRAYLFEDEEVYSIDYGANNQPPFAGISVSSFVAQVKSAISAKERR
jgi:hypothetical protein